MVDDRVDNEDDDYNDDDEDYLTSEGHDILNSAKDTTIHEERQRRLALMLRERLPGKQYCYSRSEVPSQTTHGQQPLKTCYVHHPVVVL